MRCLGSVREAAALLRETQQDKGARLHLPLYTSAYIGQRRGATNGTSMARWM
jgi:hypothetical protein